MILPHHGKKPTIDSSVWIAPSADIIGEVKIGSESGIWFQVVIRGDVNHITIGERTNVQDHSMLHVTRKTASLKIGSDVTIGHRVLLHGCTIGNRVLLGMGSVIMDGAEIEEDSVVGAGSLVTQGKKFPPNSLIMGTPAKLIRELKPEEKEFLMESANHYVADAKEYLEILKNENSEDNHEDIR